MGENSNVTVQTIVVDFRTWYKLGFEFTLFGYFNPCWVSLNVIVYSIMITVFLRNGMTSKTHVCLIMIAICDIFASVPQTLMWFFAFGIKKQYYYLPFGWCRLYHHSTEVIPRMFAYASRLLTVFLAIQRYIIVAFPFKANILCSKGKIYGWVAFCVLFPIVLLSVYFFHYDFFSFTVPAYHLENATMEACAVRGKGWFNLPFFQYIILIDFLNTTFCHFIPAILLMVFEILLLKAMNKINKKRRNMVGGSGQAKKTNLKEKRLTNTTMVITLIDLIYEIAQTSRDIISCANWLGFINEEQSNLRSANVLLQVIYWMSLPSNFIIICFCSEDFRIALKSMFCRTATTTRNGQPMVKATITSVSSRTSSSSVSSKTQY